MQTSARMAALINAFIFGGRKGSVIAIHEWSIGWWAVKYNNFVFIDMAAERGSSKTNVTQLGQGVEIDDIVTVCAFNFLNPREH